MKREELIAYDRWLTENKWGSSEIVTPEQAADLYLAEHPLPPAEGAEAFVKSKGLNLDYVKGIQLFLNPKYTVIDLMTEYAAQQQPKLDPKKVQWSGYDELGNIKPRPQTKGDFDDVLKKEKKCVCGAELKHRGGISFWCDNPHCKTAYVFDADGHISEYGTVERKGTPRQAFEGAGHHFASKEIEQPTAEGAEEILNKYANAPLIYFKGVERMMRSDIIAAMTEFATLHAQRIADKMVEKISPSNEQIHEAALAWAKDHSEAPDKDCPDWLIRDYEAGAYFVRQCYGCWNKTDKMVSERCKKCKYRGLPDSINEALNSGDGVYRP